MARRQDDEESLDAALADEEQDAEGAWLRAYLQKTPWWLLSIVLHGLVLGCLGLITFSKAIVFDDAPIEVRLAQRSEPKLPDKPRPRDVFDLQSLATEPSQAKDPEVIFPEARIADHNETANDQDTHEMLGNPDNLAALTPGMDTGMGRQVSRDPGKTSIMGAGGGGGSGGSPGGPRGGRENLRVNGGTPGTESAVLAGLYWLARHQRADGAWSADGFHERCATGARCSGPGVPQFDVGVSGLSVLTFLGAGYTHNSRKRYEDPHTKRAVDFGEVVRKGVDFLIRQQDAEGCFGPREGEYMYNHSIAALAVAEAYGMTPVLAYKGPAQRGIDFVVAAQNPALGWRYKRMPGDNDTSCTGWAVMALKSARVSGLSVPEVSFTGARAWLDRVTDSSGQAGYTSMGNVDVYVPGKNEAWGGHPSMTAIGLLLRIYIDGDQADMGLLGRASRHLVADLPRWKEHQIDAYYWYYATLALYQFKDAGGQQAWKQWNDAMKDALCPSQHVRADGCTDGSWDPELDRWGYAGGRVYLTAVNTMSLEVYYRYKQVLGGK